MKLGQQQWEHVRHKGQRGEKLPQMDSKLVLEPYAVRMGQKEMPKATCCIPCLVSNSTPPTWEWLCLSACLLFGCSSTDEEGTNSHCTSYFTEQQRHLSKGNRKQFPTCSAVLLCGLWVTSSWHSLPKVGGCRHWLMVGNELSPPWKDMETEQDYMSYSRARRKNGVKSRIRVKVLQQEAPSSRLACCLAQCGHNPAEASGQHSRMHQHELLIPAQCPTQ